MKISLILVCIAACLMLLGVQAMADFGIWIQVNPNNTTSVANPYYSADDSGYSGIWTWPFNYHGAVFVSDSDTKYHENCPMLTTTITGLDPTHIYAVTVDYLDYSKQGLACGIQAGLAGSPLTLCTAATGTLESTYDGSVDLYYQVVGQISGVSSFALNVDDTPAQGLRTYYQGLEYKDLGEAPVPEPSALLSLLGGVAGTFGYSLRRRK